MIVVVSSCVYFREGFKSLISEFIHQINDFKEIIYVNNVKEITPSHFASAKAIIVDYGQPDISCLISFFESRNTPHNTYSIFITRDSCFENALENVLINTIADFTIDSKMSITMLRLSLAHLSRVMDKTTYCKDRNLRLIEHTHSLKKIETILLPYIISGKKNKEISRYIDMSDKIISHHRRNIYKKFDVDSISGLYHAFENPGIKSIKE